MLEYIKDYYTREFPTDDMGYDLNEGVTFQDIWDLFEYEQDGDAFYNLIGVGDSLVRERLFEALSRKLDCDYDMVYYAWLHGRNLEI